MSDQPHLVVFDCDGTLVDSQHRIVECASRAFKAFDLPEPTAQNVRMGVGLPLEYALLRLMPEEAHNQIDAVADMYRRISREIVAQNIYPEALYPGLLGCLDALSQDGIRMAVATGKSRRGLRNTLAHFDLASFFHVTKTVEDGPGKPHPGILLDAISEMGGIPEKCVMIGDTTFDMEMGRSAHAHTIGVTWGYHAPEDLLAAGANRLANDYGEIPEIVRNLLS